MEPTDGGRENWGRTRPVSPWSEVPRLLQLDDVARVWGFRRCCCLQHSLDHESSQVLQHVGPRLRAAVLGKSHHMHSESVRMGDSASVK